MVRDLELSIPTGRIYAVLGANGAGKTSTMLGLLGLAPTIGRSSILGSPTISSDVRRRIGFVPQEGGIPSGATALEWLELQARFHGLPSNAAIGAAAAFDVPLHGRIARRLSGGERRRIALAAAFIGSPELLILDEPTAGLDPELRALAVERIRAVAAGGTTVLLSTHLLDEIVECADRILVMRRGTVVREAETTELVPHSSWSPSEQAAALRRILDGDA